jgi:hypothetical protein
LPQPDPPHRGNPSPLRDPLQLGVTIVVITAAFGGAGWWLDSRLGTFPILMALGAAFGLFGVIYRTYLLLKASDSDESSSSKDDHQPGERR